MKKVVIVTDSTATVPRDLIQELDIRVVPVPLSFDNQTFRDGVDITPAEIYLRLRNGKGIPTTAAPSAGDFLRIFRAVGQRASGILSIHMSPDLSTTHNVAVTASHLVADVPVRVFNCRSAAMGQGFVVLEAARAAATGATLDEVMSRAEEVASRMGLFFTLDTFEYLYRGGRIGGAATLVGTALQIKPVLCLNDGQVEVFAKPRTRRRAIRLVLREMAERIGRHPIHAAVIHADVPEEAEDLRQRVAERFNCAELHVVEFTPVMGIHTGPGVLGVVYYPE